MYVCQWSGNVDLCTDIHLQDSFIWEAQKSFKCPGCRDSTGIVRSSSLIRTVYIHVLLYN